MEFKYRLLGVSVATLCMYLIDSFIAWDLNPMNWWLFTTILGRIFVAIYIVALVSSLINDEI